MRAPELSFSCDASRRSLSGTLRSTLVLFPLILGAAYCQAQLPSAADPGMPASPGPRQPGGQEQDPGQAREAHKMAERRNDLREQELVADTRKLLELAQSLNDDVSKTNKNELSLDVIKRAEQIEKLARSVREKMRGYY